ncbi:MAG: type I-U CRISPR-associated protein Csx17, partial [Planctomycetaceae bacterium]
LDAVGMAASRSSDSDAAWWFPILASGGGEASGQYIVNHQQRLKSVLLDDQEQSRARLEASLFGLNQPGSLEGNSMGAMYFPSLMKVPNAGQDFLPTPQRRVNPWDFILLLEGCLVWSIAATRRQGVTSERASFPFYCRASFGGSTMIGPKEIEGADKSISKGELWCPTWNSPSTLLEIQRIFSDGRIQVGEEVSSRSLDFALAMRGLGTDRGIEAFHRYSFLERSGSGRQTTLLAVPTGCFVPEQASGLALVAELRDFAVSVATNLTENGQQPRRLMSARILFERAWFDATTSPSNANGNLGNSLSDLIVAAGRVTRELGTHSAKPGFVKIKKGEQTSERLINPIGDLQSEWSALIAKSDPSPELRLARSIAGITAWGEATAEGRVVSSVESIRANLLPLTRCGKRWVWNATSHTAVWSRGAPLEVNLAAVLRRRLIDAQRGSGDGLPLWSVYGVGFEDLLAYWRGTVNADRLDNFIHGLALVDPGEWDEASINHRQHRDDPTPDLENCAVWFDANDDARTTLAPIEWSGRQLLSMRDFRAAFELPRIYHLLKLCFVGGKMPRRPVQGKTVTRTGNEPFPNVSLDVLA